MQPPAQELVAKDLHDTTWTFRHIYRGIKLQFSSNITKCSVFNSYCQIFLQKMYYTSLPNKLNLIMINQSIILVNQKKWHLDDVHYRITHHSYNSYLVIVSSTCSFNLDIIGLIYQNFIMRSL